jgi:hypothetical protein
VTREQAHAALVQTQNDLIEAVMLCKLNYDEEAKEMHALEEKVGVLF